ncbi:Ig-like domain-containing protein [Asanoa iriomotensis]|uniref:Bacterial Ig-like domain-containing protein n=1 Tax=Asanoa iriomotensis TaxID=234613 RepID=A0ABQ4CBF1_9ACTN|nr:Ig-like domain-containing protein [Asanoa iriomotensis]GIF60094.1 hypothetical protein Air01nite_61890 [Asanoa iriomotensis]
MSRRRTSRLIARACVLAAAITSIAGGTVVIASSAASAASLGDVTLSQSTGTVNDTPMFRRATTPKCPAGYGENAGLRVGKPGGPYSNIAVPLGGGGFDEAPITVRPNRSFTTALGGTPPGDGDWLVIMECYSLTEGRNNDEFQTRITVCGDKWAVGPDCPDGFTASSVALTTSPAWSAVAGEEVTLTATVTPATAGGVVEFVYTAPGETEDRSLGTATVADGRAELRTSEIPPNLSGQSHLLTALYGPPGKFFPSSATPVKLNVRQATDPVPTEIKLSITPASPVAHGTEVTLTATLEPADAAGTVTFSYRRGSADAPTPIGAAVPVADHAASTKTTTLPGGKLDIQAAFASDTGFGLSTVTVTDYEVTGGGGEDPNKTKTSVELTLSTQGDVAVGTTLILTGKITPTGAGGRVTFRDGSTVLGVPTEVAQAQAAISVNNLALGSHQLTAEFVPTDTAQFEGSTSPVKTVRVVEVADDSGGDDPGGDDDGSGGGGLALTGAPIVGVSMVGAGLIGIGVLAMTAGRRRRLFPAVPWLDRSDDDD